MKRKINVIKEATGLCEPANRSGGTGRFSEVKDARISVQEGAVCPAQK